MKLNFPPDFIFGTSTSACQIETAFEHDWQGLRSEDNYVFERTTDHELRVDEDVDIIATLAPHYRMGLMWSKLQRASFAPLHEETKIHYHKLLDMLRERNITIMLVLHHFCNPAWFAATGGWSRKSNVDAFVDFGKKVIDEFGPYVHYWNTFNEPNLYATMGYAAGKFPPYKRNILTTVNVIKNMGRAHDILYDYIKSKHPHHQIGISQNCAIFEGTNFAGKVIAKLADQWYMEFLPKHFRKTDFTGLSYYARMCFDPLPITFRYSPEKIKRLNKRHDDIWEYYPDGLRISIARYWNKFGKPIIITENGICTNDDTQRIEALKDYMKIIHASRMSGIDVKGYFHWSTWDNFEWTLGPTFRFGLYTCDPQTRERIKNPSADVYAQLSHNKVIEVDD